jgi:hypothetical protein
LVFVVLICKGIGFSFVKAATWLSGGLSGFLDFKSILLGVGFERTFVLTNEFRSEDFVCIRHAIVDFPVVRKYVGSLDDIQWAISVLKLLVMVRKPVFHRRGVVFGLGGALLLLVLVAVDLNLR